MSVPVQHNLITGAYLPLLKRIVNNRDNNILFHDYYPEIYQRFGIRRDEMMILMPQVMSVDILAGMDTLEYIGEEKLCQGTTAREGRSERLTPAPDAAKKK